MLKAASIVLIFVALSSLVMGVVYVASGTLMEYHEEFIGIALSGKSVFTNSHRA